MHILRRPTTGGWARLSCLVLLSLPACKPQRNSMREQSDGSKISSQEGTGTGKTCLNIVGGKETSDFPSVYRISYNLSGSSWYTCTGTFISDNTMVTAAHCMPLSGEASDLYADSNKLLPSQDTAPGRRATKIFFPSQCGPSPMNGGKRACENVGDDVAIVIFPDRTASHWLPVASAPMPLKTQVTIVGYGETNLDISPSATPTNGNLLRKKFGYNQLTKAPAGLARLNAGIGGDSDTNTYTIVGWRRDGEAAARGANTAVPAQGDSGGPLIAKDAVIGVSSTYFVMDETLPEDNFDVIEGYASLHGTTAQRLFQEAAAAGARIGYSKGSSETISTPGKSDATTVASKTEKNSASSGCLN